MTAHKTDTKPGHVLRIAHIPLKHDDIPSAPFHPWFVRKFIRKEKEMILQPNMVLWTLQGKHRGLSRSPGMGRGNCLIISVACLFF